MATTVKFVDSIASSPTTRLDLNDKATWRTLLSSEFPPPQVRRAIASTLLTDGGYVAASAYDNRELRLQLALLTSAQDTMATEVQKLARELDRPGNFLQWQPGTTNPVFFRTFSSQVDSLRPLGRSENGDMLFEASILAEPFAYGLKETLSPVTVNNDPAAGSNGMFLDVSSPKGDVETPLFMVIGTTVADVNGFTSVVATRRRGTVTALPLVLQAETMTLGSNTTLPGNDAAMSGAGSNYARCSSSASPSVSTTAFPSSASVDARGRYRVYARMRHSIGTDTISVQLVTGGLSNTAVTLPAVTGLRWIDLGDIVIPRGYDPISDGYSGTELAAVGTSLSLNITRSVGSGTTDVDVFLLVPLDDPPLLVKWATSTSGSDYVLDAAQTLIYSRDGSGNVRGESPVQIVGRPPMVTPGRTNRVVFAPSINLASGADDKADTVSVTPYYFPRYLYVKPAST